MMSENRYFMFLLVSAVAGLLSVSGAGIRVKYVCSGDSVQAFQNIEFNHCNAKVTLNINGDRNEEIATWSIQNCIQNDSILPEYKERLIFDQNGTITMKNFDHFDQAKYVVISKMDPLPKIYEVHLSKMVAPTKACKPMIDKLGNILIASLNAKDCGIPVATPYWEDYRGVSNTNEPILKLTPGTDATEYYACIKGDAVTCVKHVQSHDYCTKYITEGSKSPPARMETCNSDALIAVCIILGIIVILAVLALSVVYIRYRPREKNANDEQTNMLMETKHFGKLEWEDIRKLLNHDQQMGLQTYCDNLKPQKDNQRQEKERQCDIENDREDASTEQQSCNDPDKIKELRELRDAILCKICVRRKRSVFFLPCTHIATCTKCSSSLQQCPVCRAEIKQKLKICFD